MIPPLPSDIFRQGQVLNNTYEIDGVIGRGGLGEVYRARNLVSKRVVAIKALPRQFSSDDRYVELMRREERIREIRHEAVVRYTECARTAEGHVFIVMDFIDGPSLRDELKRRRLASHELLVIANRVADGLRAAHQQGIIHRDLSPDNIILRDGQPQGATIIDFGIAKDTASSDETIVGNGFAGKFGYAAPEQFEGRVDARSDLYALGASLLAAYRGEVPFAGLTMLEVVRRKREPLDTRGVPEPLRSFIDRLTAPDPDKRPTSAAEMTTIIHRIMTDEPTVLSETVPAPPSREHPADDPRPPERARGQVDHRRKDRTFDILAVTTAVALAGGAAVLWQLGVFDRFTTPALPTASPYRLMASCAPLSDDVEATENGFCQATLEGNAPDPEAVTRLVQAVADAGGTLQGEPPLVLAQGLPMEGWVDAMEAFISLAGSLEDWTVEAEDQGIRVTGIARNRSERDAAELALAERARAAGLSAELALAVGPRILAQETVLGALEPATTCGELTLADAPDEGYALGDTVRVEGTLATPDDRELIRQAVAEVAGDREVDASRIVELNPHLCAIYEALPTSTDDIMTIALRTGASGRADPAGVFETGSQIDVELQLPATLEEEFLWVFMVSGSGVVYHLLPTIQSPENRVGQLGTVEGETRIIPILPKVTSDGRTLGFVAREDDLGRGQVIAILSDKPILELRPSMGESTEALEEALVPVLRERSGDLVSVLVRDFEVRAPQ